jgi:hypothetical protein
MAKKQLGYIYKTKLLSPLIALTRAVSILVSKFWL